MAKNLNISGVEGWLGFLVAIFMILTPLALLGSLSQFIDVVEQSPLFVNIPEWQIYKQVSWLIVMAGATISFIAGYRLWKTHLSESVKFAILALWLTGPLASLLLGIAAIVIFGIDDGGSMFSEQLFGTTFTAVIAASIWTAYLSKSQRVRNTYQYQVNEVSSDGVTPLMMAAMLGKNEQILELITAGAHIDAVDERGWTPLMYAASRNEIETVEFLLKRGSSTVLRNIENQTAAEIAQSKGYDEVVIALQS